MNVGFHPIQLVEIMFESSDSEAEHEDTVVTSTYKWPYQEMGLPEDYTTLQAMYLRERKYIY